MTGYYSSVINGPKYGYKTLIEYKNGYQACDCGYKTSYRIYDLISELKQGLNNSEIWNYL